MGHLPEYWVEEGRRLGQPHHRRVSLHTIPSAKSIFKKGKACAFIKKTPLQ
jgi:hypothetical protein